MITKFVAAQLRQPSGFIGRRIILRLLNHLNISINLLALKLLQLTPDDDVLEIGFGGGDLMERMSQVLTQGHITGIDFSIDAVKSCSKRFKMQIKAGTIDLHCANVENLPFDPDTFTKACTVNTIYFWSAPLVALTQIRRVLKKDGSLVVCFTPRVFMEGQSVTRHGFTLYDPEEVIDLFKTAGFRDVQLIFGKHRLGECVAVEGKK